MDKPSILVVEDEMPIRSMLRCALEVGGFYVREAQDTKVAVTLLNEKIPDLLLLDWMLPNQSGIDFTKQLKQHSIMRHIPIIMLTAKATEENKVCGLDAGADDYIVKPFSPRELIARIHAVLRRGGSRKQSDDTLKVRELIIETDNQRVLIAGIPVKLVPMEYKLLCFFMRHPERVYSRDELLTYVWGNDTFVDERTVDVHIRRLRKQLALGGHEALIQTVHGSGYRFSEDTVE